MRKRARGQEVKGKKVKEPLKSRVYLFCEGCTERIYLSHFENKAYNVKVVPVDTGHASQEKVHDKVYSHECNPYTDMFRFLEYMWELKERNSREV